MSRFAGALLSVILAASISQSEPVDNQEAARSGSVTTMPIFHGPPAPISTIVDSPLRILPPTPVDNSALAGILAAPPRCQESSCGSSLGAELLWTAESATARVTSCVLSSLEPEIVCSLLPTSEALEYELAISWSGNAAAVLHIISTVQADGPEQSTHSIELATGVQSSLIERVPPELSGGPLLLVLHKFDGGMFEIHRMTLEEVE